MLDSVTIAAVQMNPGIAQNDKNLDRIVFQLESAAEKGANLITFPECAVSGYVFTSRAEALPFAYTIPGEVADRLSVQCKELGVYLVLGLLEKDDDKCYNSALFLGPEGLIGRYRKNHLPFLGIDRFIDAGNEPYKVYPTPIGNIGINICYDCSFPEGARVMMLLGADIIVLPTNWPEGREKNAQYVVNTRAFENRVHLVAVNRVGYERGTKFIGRSKIISASGDTLVEASKDDEEIIYATVSLAEAREKHVVIKAGEYELDFIHDRRPELYGEITR